MTKYVFKYNNVTYQGAMYQRGDEIELAEEEARNIQHVLDSSKTEEKTVNYNDMTTNELKKLVDEKGLEVIETGKNGAVKADYIKALEQ